MSNHGDRILSRMATRSPYEPRGITEKGITIAIPNWNHEYVLPRSIQSGLRAVEILAEQGIPAEVLVVDDQSRDGSLTLLRQLEALYATKGLRVLALPVNAGLPSVRNEALTHASYRYLVFMDADNSLIPENLYHFYRSITATKAAVVYGNLNIVGSEGKIHGYHSNEPFKTEIFLANYIDAFAMFDRQQLIDLGGYLNTIDVIAREDWELYLHLAANGRKVIFVPLIFGNYHVLPGSMIQEEAIVESESPQQKHMKRVYDQLNVRQKFQIKTLHLRYHPDIGYL